MRCLAVTHMRDTYETKHQPETTARPRTHTTTHAARTPKTPMRTPLPNTGKDHHITPVRDRDHMYTNSLIHLLYLFHRFTLTPLTKAAASTARHSNQGPDPTSTLYLRPRHTTATSYLIVFFSTYFRKIDKK